MIRYQSRTRIERPASAVFAAMTDPDLFSQWTDMVDMKFESGAPRVGMKGSFRLARGPIKGRLATEITELIPDRLVTYHITHPVMQWDAVARIEPRGEGASELDYGGTITLRGWRRLLEPLMAAEVRSSERAEAGRLKALLEAGSTAAAPKPAEA